MAHWHTVRQGESIPSIAERYGFNDWNVLYQHGENGDLRSLRPDPNVLAPGDKVFIPTKEQKYVEVATEQTHRFQLSRRMEQIRLVLEDEDGTVFAGKKYVLTVGSIEVEGTTDGDGVLEEEVPAIADEAELQVWLEDGAAPMVWKLDIGRLDPIDTVSGVQARLNNLGFDSGPEDGDLGEQTAAALKAFQQRMGLEPSGILDDETKQRLVAEHGS